jgi:hypothetical protein
MKPRNRVMNWLGRNAPVLNAVPLAAMAWSLATSARRKRGLKREMHACIRPGLQADSHA